MANLVWLGADFGILFRSVIARAAPENNLARGLSTDFINDDPITVARTTTVASLDLVLS